MLILGKLPSNFEKFAVWHNAPLNCRTHASSFKITTSLNLPLHGLTDALPDLNLAGHVALSIRNSRTDQIAAMLTAKPIANRHWLTTGFTVCMGSNSNPAGSLAAFALAACLGYIYQILGLSALTICVAGS